MTIYEFYDEFDGITNPRKKEFLHKLIDHIIDNDAEDYEPGWDLMNFLDALMMYEQEDGFGTEGFKG